MESEEKLWDEKSIDLVSVAWPLSPSLLNGASSPSVSMNNDQLYSGERALSAPLPFLRVPLFTAPTSLAAGIGEGRTAAPTVHAEQSMEM